MDTDKGSEPCITMPMKLFGVGEGALDGFLSSLVDFFAVRREAVFVGGIACVLPDMAVKFARLVFGAGAGCEQGAFGALLWIAAILAIAFAIGRRIGQELAIGAGIAVFVSVIDEAAFIHHARCWRIWSPVPCDAHDVALYQALSNGDGGIARVETNSVYVKPKALDLAIKAAQINAAIIDITGRCMGVGDDLFVYRATASQRA